MLDIQEAFAGYGEKSVLNGISITVREGEFVALIGANAFPVFCH